LSNGQSRAAENACRHGLTKKGSNPVLEQILRSDNGDGSVKLHVRVTVVAPTQPTHNLVAHCVFGDLNRNGEYDKDHNEWEPVQLLVLPDVSWQPTGAPNVYRAEFDHVIWAPNAASKQLCGRAWTRYSLEPAVTPALEAVSSDDEPPTAAVAAQGADSARFWRGESGFGRSNIVCTGGNEPAVPEAGAVGAISAAGVAMAAGAYWFTRRRRVAVV
jgi:hypothetical protein